MAIFIDPLILGSSVPWGSLETSDPVTGYDGQVILNTTDSTIKIWYNLCWNVWFSLTPGTPPANVDLTNEDGTTLTNEDGTTLQREP